MNSMMCVATSVDMTYLFSPFILPLPGTLWLITIVSSTRLKTKSRPPVETRAMSLSCHDIVAAAPS